LRRWARPECGAGTSGLDGAGLARLVRLAATYSPFSVTCLPRAGVLWALQRAHGLAPAIVFGVRKNGAGVDAHAWVELEGAVYDDAGGPAFVPLHPYVAPVGRASSADAT